MVRTAGYNLNLISTEGIQSLLEYIPYFESNEKFGEYAQVDRGCIGCSILSDKASLFMHACYDFNFVQDFDWPRWSKHKRSLIRDGEGVESLNLEEIGKLLTAHIRADRFCDGHLLSIMENGQMLLVLYRLSDIKKQMEKR